MILAIEIIGCWVLLNVTVVPALTWWIFRNHRHTRDLRASWRSSHPTTPWGLMPTYIAGRSPKQAKAFSREFIE